MGASAADGMSIGDVLVQLRAEFPSLRISKIRFLEEQGLIQPRRTASNYRKYSHGDVARLRHVLVLQRDHYLPLNVIKEQLAAGSDTPETGPKAPHPNVVAVTERSIVPELFRTTSTSQKLARDDFLSQSGLRIDKLRELETFGLITPRPGGVYDEDALAVAKIVVDLARFGIEPRHLRPFRTAADREINLFGQVVGPVARQRDENAKSRAEEAVRELASLSVRLHAALVQNGLREIVRSN